MIGAGPAADRLDVLVLAPFGRDGRLTTEVLEEAGIVAIECITIDEIERGLRDGAGALVVAMEALLPNLRSLTALLHQQPEWSDIPLILATASGHGRTTHDWALQTLQPARHITFLERPIRIRTLISVVRSALATRQHQYATRNLIEELRQTVAALDVEQEMRDRFVALLAHDLRGPLTVAWMSAELVRMAPERVQRTQELAARIVNGIDRAEAMIRTMLDAHRLRSGHPLQLDRSRCDLVAIARDVADDIGLEQNASIAVNAPESLAGQWDGGLLRRALWNLVTNAVKYGACDQTVTITLENDGAQAVVHVHNHGPTLPPEAVEPLFLAGTTEGVQSGASPSWGLGLVLVQGAATAHGGAVDVVSDAERGTTFTLRLPFS